MVSTDEKQSRILQSAHQLFSQGTDWVTFYRQILGISGVVRRNFPSRDELAEFEKTEVYDEIQQMLTQLRQKQLEETEEQEPTRVITVRLPSSLHEALRVEAFEHHTSMNKLCISKLLQFIDAQKVPTTL